MPNREEYIEVLSKTVKAVKELNKDAPIKISLECIEDILKLLKEQPEIVRCKDCKYAVLTYHGDLKYCKYFVDEYGFTNGGDPLYLDSDFFCAVADRR